MTRKVIRKIHIGNTEYSWVANCNDLALYPFKEMNIRVHLTKNSKSILYIDATAWHFELSPKHIKDSIEYALGHGWKPTVAGCDLCISKNEAGYFIMTP